MRIPIQTFSQGINDLLRFLTSTEHESELIELRLQRALQQVAEVPTPDRKPDRESELLTLIASAGTDRKRYTYTVAIVTLYGLLERLVDTLIEGYVCELAKALGSYDMMPPAIKDKHIRLSLDFAKMIGDRKFRTSMSQSEAIANLHSCLSNAPDFRVNGSAFALHRGNLNHERICAYFSDLGVAISFRRLLLTQDMLAFFVKKQPERDIYKIADQDLFNLFAPINELVDRRNELSHGVITIDNIESIDLLKERCEFVLAYGFSLHDILFQDILSYKVKLPGVTILGKPIAVHGHRIICFEVSNCRICQGDLIAAATSRLSEPFRFGVVLSLEISNVPHQVIDATLPTKFGARVPFKAHDDWIYYLIPKELA